MVWILLILIFGSCSLFEVYNDHEGPEVTVRYPLQGSVFSAGEIRLSGTAYDNETRVKNVWYAFLGLTNQAVFQEGAWNGILYVTNTGNYRVNIWAKDLLGNQSDLIYRDFTVTNSPPVNPALYLTLADNSSTNAVELTFGQNQTNALKIGVDEYNWAFFVQTNFGQTTLQVERLSLSQTNAFWISLYTNVAYDAFETRYFSLSETQTIFVISSEVSKLFIETYAPLNSNEIRFLLSINTN